MYWYGYASSKQKEAIMNMWQWCSGATMLGAILLFGLQGIAVQVQAGDFRYIKDPLYEEECGACHLAYPPQLLPESAWHNVMDTLEDHFGESAELDAATSAENMNYLSEYALGKGAPSRMSQMMRNLPEELPLRITEYPAFINAHELVKQQLDIEQFDEGFLSPCADCHRQAGSGLFDKELLHPGYGPASAWQ